MSKQSRRFYDFGAFRLDTTNHRLTRDGEVIPLTPKEYEVLLVLIENAGDTVAKDALLEAVWKDAFVGDETLMRNVSWLRKKLGAGIPTGEKLIETVPKRGYRFAAPVAGSDDAEMIIEEETLTHVSIEETLIFPDAEAIGPADAAGKFTALPPEKPIGALPGVSVSDNFRRSLLLPLALGVIAAVAVAFLVYQNFFAQNRQRMIFAPKIAPFSGLSGRENTPAFSPDGKQIVYTWNGGDGDNKDVYVKLIGVGEPVRLTNTANDELYPVFSPDARQIAFVRAFPDHEEIILIPAMGGAERRIGEVRSGRASISFSPDGQYLAVVDTDETLKVPIIFLLDWQTGERRRATDSTESIIENTPRFSPDGKTLAFLHYYSDSVQELFVVPAAGGAARQLTFDKAKLRSLAWSADGKRIFFVSLRQNNQPNLWQIEAASDRPPELISTSGKNISYAAASPDGETIALVEQSENNNIWQITPADKRARKLIASTLSSIDPQFSPDDQRIVYTSERSGNNEIWIADADGRDSRQLTFSPSIVGSPRFSPDGKFIAYNSQSGEIYVIPAEGGAPRQLTAAGAKNVLPAWSADGQWIYFASNRSGEYQLWKMSANGGEAVQITRQGALSSFAAPDGKWIYYSKSKNEIELWRVAANGGDEQRVPELADAGFWRAWTITKNGICYVADAAQPPYKIKFYNFSNKKTEEIAATDKPPLIYGSTLSASADGKAILYARKDQENSSIMLVKFEK